MLDLTGIKLINGVYQFTDDAAVSVGDGLKWLGYEGVGENYEPGFYSDPKNDKIGCSKNFAEFFHPAAFNGNPRWISTHLRGGFLPFLVHLLEFFGHGK